MTDGVVFKWTAMGVGVRSQRIVAHVLYIIGSDLTENTQGLHVLTAANMKIEPFGM
jgi:hypothetical protein